MAIRIGVRREDKSRWERRTPLIPSDMARLAEECNLEFVVQSSDIRIFSDEEYRAVGIRVEESLPSCSIILGVKEIPLELIEPHKTYIFFSHVIKGQRYNMPMLQQLLDLKCQLIDYETFIDQQGRRLIFFGWHAGVAGMIDSLRALGLRLRERGLDTLFATLPQTHHFANLSEARNEFDRLAEAIRKSGIPKELSPLVIGFAGDGNVSRGAQEIFNRLPFEELSAEDLVNRFDDLRGETHRLFKVVFREQDLVEPINENQEFVLQDYYDNPQKYRSRFMTYAHRLTVLLNCIYWDTPYPRILSRVDLRTLFTTPEPPRLQVIGDISCDIEGAIEATVKCTQPDQPVYVYDPETGKTNLGVAGSGIVILAVDNLPCELPRDSSVDFSNVLQKFIPEIGAIDFEIPFEKLELPPEIRRAVIAYHGKLTNTYRYLRQYLG